LVQDLGEESIKSGSFATILSIIIIMILVFVMYKFFGIFTNIALIVNLLLIVSALAIFNIVLTLPGIAGIALTLWYGS
jgi:preprotein translocase subunit SecD